MAHCGKHPLSWTDFAQITQDFSSGLTEIMANNMCDAHCDLHKTEVKLVINVCTITGLAVYIIENIQVSLLKEVS